MTQQRAKTLLGALLIALFAGTLMPGHWKESALRPMHSPIDLSMVAHVVLFTAMAMVLPQARPWRLRWWHLPLAGLALALLTEGLQFFAIDRHPNLAGVAQDMAGTFMGWALARLWDARRPAVAAAAGRANGASSRDRASPPSGR